MNAPVLTFSFEPGASPAFADLDEVRLLVPKHTTRGVLLPAGAEGTVVGVWADGAAYEVEFDAGLATVEAAALAAAG